MGISGDGVKVLTKGKTQRKSVRQGKRVKVQKSTTKSLALETKAMHSLSLCHHQQQAAGSGMPQSKSRSVGEGATPKRPGAVIDLVKQGSTAANRRPVDGCICGGEALNLRHCAIRPNARAKKAARADVPVTIGRMAEGCKHQVHG